jgi:hypothetical protein
MLLPEEEFCEYKDDYIGYCSHCDAFTTDSVEPDAEDYDCIECGNNTVMGAEEALLKGHIEFL